MFPPNSRYGLKGRDNDIILTEKINPLPILAVEHMQFEGIRTDVPKIEMLDLSDVRAARENTFC